MSALDKPVGIRHMLASIALTSKCKDKGVVEDRSVVRNRGGNQLLNEVKEVEKVIQQKTVSQSPKRLTQHTTSKELETLLKETQVNSTGL